MLSEINRGANLGHDGGGAGRAFSNANHLLVLSEERRYRHKNRDEANGATLKSLVGYFVGTNRRLLLGAKNECAWRNVRSTIVTVTLLSAT